MDCKKMAKRLHEFLDQEMDEKSCQEFQMHLVACEPCFNRVEFEKVLRLAVKKGCVCKMPAGLKNKVLQSIHGSAKEEMASPRGKAPKKKRTSLKKK